MIGVGLAEVAGGRGAWRLAEQFLDRGRGDLFTLKTPVEVHIHANNWGFLSLVFAGILVDTYSNWAQRSLACSKRSGGWTLAARSWMRMPVATEPVSTLTAPLG